MDAQADWFKKRGFRVIVSKSSGWVDVARGVYQAFPYHWIIDPSEEELAEIFRKDRAIALRYSTALDKPSGQISYHVCYDKGSYPLTSLAKKARYDVTHGLAYACCVPISLRCLAREGWKLRYETLVRQGRQGAETRESWESMCSCADGLPGFEAWGAIHEGELVAALLTYTSEDTASILYQQSRTEHLKYGVNHALTYGFSQAVLHRPGIRCIFYGLHSLDAPPGVDEYKFRMRYSARPVRQQVVFSPVVQPFVNCLSYGFLRLVLSLRPGSSLLSKAEGMLRFHLQGKRSLSEQVWPEALLPQKDAILREVGMQGESAQLES